MNKRFFLPWMGALMTRMVTLSAQRHWHTRIHHTSHGEKLIAAVGGLISLLAVLWISGRLLDYHGASMVVASIGATVVLLFAVPHSALSQPWSVLGGHLTAALIGVTCAQFIAVPLIAAAVAVGLAILAMYYLRCLHPPGGATALIAVLGGESVQQLGYGFVLTPVLANVLVVLAVAVLFNLPFQWRRYPAGLARPSLSAREAPGEKTMIAHSDLVYALSQLDTFIDVTEQDLIRIYTLAVHHSHTPVPCHQQGKACQYGHADCLCRQMMGISTQ
jgi:CBS domain-containing membrane protein